MPPKPSKSCSPRPTGRPEHRRLAPRRSQRLQVLQQVVDLLFAKLVAGDVFRRMRTAQRLAKRVCAAVVQQFHLLVNAAQARRVDSLVAVARAAEADVMVLAIGEIQTAVAARAAGSVALEHALAALG